MHADAYYEIGKSHTVCQDVARAGLLSDKTPVALVCDGCSGSPQTELGAQLLAQIVMSLLSQRSSVQDKVRHAIWTAAGVAAHASLPWEALDATVLVAWVDHGVPGQIDARAHIEMWGDGAVLHKGRDGSQTLTSVEFYKGAPSYPGYHLDKPRRDAYLAESDDASRRVSTFTRAPCGRFVATAESVERGFTPTRLSFPVSETELVLLASDGLSSFTRREGSAFVAVPVEEVAAAAFGFKSFVGSFVTRRLRRFLSVEAPKLGWRHEDDLAVAGIYLGDAG